MAIIALASAPLIVAGAAIAYRGFEAERFSIVAIVATIGMLAVGCTAAACALLLGRENRRAAAVAITSIYLALYLVEA